MTLSEYYLYIQCLSEIDNRPKNIGGKPNECKEMRVEWYSPEKHKETILKSVHYSHITGYELDKSSFYDNYNRLCFCIYTGDIVVHIYAEDFFEIINEYNNTQHYGKLQ